MIFRLKPLRFHFTALEPIHFPSGQASNILRGAFGVTLRGLFCFPQCKEARKCPRRMDCLYARIFEPSAIAAGPSGLADWPRPFVFRATHLDGWTIAEGRAFSFDVNLFDTDSCVVDAMVRTCSAFGRGGVGPGRRKAELTTVAQLNEDGAESAAVFEDGTMRDQQNRALELDLAPEPDPVACIRVRFLTPTELKAGQQLASQPEFRVLASRVRDRISALRQLYGDGALDIDFRGFGERASLVRLIRCEISSVDARRRSTRTGQAHAIGGFVGEADYEGSLAEFLPYLRAAKWTGVGRQTVWGKGAIAVHVLR